MSDKGFDYSNLSGRPPGPFTTWASRLLRSVRRVQGQIEPYADAWQRSNRAALQREGPLLVVLGDSMAQGIGASAPDRGWAGQLADALPEHRLVNLSFYGARTADLLDRQLPAMEALGVAPDLVAVIIGSNDLFSSRHRPTLPGALAAVLDRVPRGTVFATQPGGRPESLAFNQQVDDAAAEGRVVVADFRDRRMRSWRGKLSDDHFHPNDLGYAGMAQIVAEAVARRR